MIQLGIGELTGLKARGLRKQEFDAVLRNQRIREETQRAHMRALLTLPPRDFPRGELGRIALFHVNITRVAPAGHQLPAAELPGSLEPVRAGIATHLDPGGTRLRFAYAEAIGPWAVRFSIHDDSPSAPLSAVDPDFEHMEDL